MDIKYINAEQKARQVTDTFFSNILAPKLTISKQAIFNYKHTPITDSLPYDTVFTVTEPLSQKVFMRAFIEVKVRNSNYDSQIMQKDKNDNLLKLKELYKDNVYTKIFYLVFEQDRAFLFNVLTQFNNNKNNWVKRYIQKTTCGDTTKVEKTVTFWDNSDANIYNFNYTTDTTVNPSLTPESFGITGVHKESFESKSNFILDKMIYENKF